MFTCRVCTSSNLELSQMKKEKRLVESLRGICKSCSSEYEKFRVARQKADRDENNHLQCDDCDRVFYKYSRGNPCGNNKITNSQPELYELTYKKLLNVNCPFCKSENIERY